MGSARRSRQHTIKAYSEGLRVCAKGQMVNVFFDLPGADPSASTMRITAALRTHNPIRVPPWPALVARTVVVIVSRRR